MKACWKDIHEMMEHKRMEKTSARNKWAALINE